MMKVGCIYPDEDTEIVEGNIPFASKSFRDMEIIPAPFTFWWKPGALIKSGNTTLKINRIDNISISIRIEGEFEPLSQSKSFQKEGDRSEI